MRTPASDRDATTRLVTLARAQAPLRRALARVAGRLVGARAWEHLGYARLCDYAVERAGVSARQLQDLAHVDGALARLPRLEAAFVAGDLTWTQARLLARVATPEDTPPWEPANGCATHAAGGHDREPPLPDEQAPEAAVSPGTPAPGPAFLQNLVTGLDETDPFELDARLRRALRPAPGRRRGPGDRQRRSRGRARALANGCAPHGPGRDGPDHLRRAARGSAFVPGSAGHHATPHREENGAPFRSAGGSDEPRNCTTLCAFHHLRGVHAGRVACSGDAPDTLRFALGLRRGYPPMLDFGPGERLISAA